MVEKAWYIEAQLLIWRVMAMRGSCRRSQCFPFQSIPCSWDTKMSRWDKGFYRNLSVPDVEAPRWSNTLFSTHTLIRGSLSSSQETNSFLALEQLIYFPNLFFETLQWRYIQALGKVPVRRWWPGHRVSCLFVLCVPGWWQYSEKRCGCRQ